MSSWPISAWTPANDLAWVLRPVYRYSASVRVDRPAVRAGLEPVSRCVCFFQLIRRNSL